MRPAGFNSRLQLKEKIWGVVLEKLEWILQLGTWGTTTPPPVLELSMVSSARSHRADHFAPNESSVAQI